MNLSIIIPLYNERASMPELIAWIYAEIKDKIKDFEILLIDDGSTDGSWQEIINLRQQYKEIKALQFRRNYGKSAALNEGFKLSQGDVVITMDADMQDSPEEIVEMYQMIKQEGFDLVSGWKKKRKDPFSKTVPSIVFNRVTGWLTRIKLHDFNCGLKAYSKDVVKNIELFGEMHRYIPVIAKWNGFSNITEKVVVHYPRKYGKSKFGLKRFIHGFLDLLSVMFIGKFSKNPMHFFGVLGTFSFIIGFIITAYLIAEKLTAIAHQEKYRNVVEQPLFFIALGIMIVGVHFFLTGFLAELIIRNKSDRTYQIKNTIE